MPTPALQSPRQNCKSNDPTGCMKRSGHHRNAGDAGAPDRWLPGRVRGDSPPRGGGGVARVLRHGGAGSRPGAKPGKCALRRPDLKANFLQPFGQHTAYWTKHSVTTHPNLKAFNALNGTLSCCNFQESCFSKSYLCLSDFTSLKLRL